MTNAWLRAISGLQKKPDNGVVLTYKGVIHHERKEYEEAVRYYARVNDLYPWFPLAWEKRGECLLMLRDYITAGEVFFEAFKLNPHNDQTICSSAVSYFMQGKEQLAVMLLEAMTERYEKKDLIYTIKGMLHEKMGDKEGAFQSYLQCQIEGQSEWGKSEAALRIGLLLNTGE